MVDAMSCRCCARVDTRGRAGAHLSGRPFRGPGHERRATTPSPWSVPSALQEDTGRGKRSTGSSELERVGDLSNAAKSYIRAAAILVNDAEAQIKGGTMLLLNKRFEEARDRANRALILEPRNIRAQVLLAHALSGMRQTGQALASIQKAITSTDQRDTTPISRSSSSRTDLRAGRGER